MPQFSHLHCHTQFSLLDGAAPIKELYKKAVNDGQPALAITDHGNMFGAFKFVAQAAVHNKKGSSPTIKPIVGCEFYLVENRHQKQFTREVRDKRYHQLLLAKNATGYKNLVKLCSLGFIEGMYSKYPRIDKELVLKYHEGLIATSCCLAASIPQAILRKSEEEAEKEFRWWFELFGEDFYIELQRHDIEDQNKVNEVLLRYAAKYNVKVICSNDSHYVDQEDANAHDILLCINTGEKQSTPKMKDFAEDGGKTKGTRFAFANDQFYFKTQAEMGRVFHDLPEALDNTNEIVDKVDMLELKRDILLPNYRIPEGFADQNAFLRHMTYEGARKRYGEITPEIKERLDFELFTIETMGFAGYFLITQDFINKGKEIGVLVGPGRGSAAGSAVAYCIGITNIDPIKYDLLFERFLNPKRKSMPDIDTDFDDEGRQKVIDYVVDKYGKDQVAHIVTYGTMAAKMSIKDTARVMDLPLPEANALAKLVPDRPGTNLGRMLRAPLKGEGSIVQKEGVKGDDLVNVKKLREILEGNDMQAMVLQSAEKLEGSVRGTGIHAAGIIIAPTDLKEIVPVCTAKDVELLVTQFDGRVIEDAGVIKMDFLGLKTLTIIRDALALIKKNYGTDIAIDDIPLDDKKTLELYQKAQTNGTFQFESDGMQKWLKLLKPDQFEDLIAMNALYRPGPMDYIPDFIARKHGKQEVTYDLPDMEEYLQETYGITVYQEQVMLLSQKLGNFDKGDADILRKAMGKKDKATLDKMKGQFMEGTAANGHPADICEKIWTDWEAFASYAFNKSHSTCYAFVAYQTAYLKANYPAEYMASVLTHNLNNIDKVTFFMDECRRMGIPVLGPDLNESIYSFGVNKKGEIRFGLGAVKGVGEGAVQAIVDEREANGPYTSALDLVRRVELRSVNKRCIESLIISGAFDSISPDVDRAQYLHEKESGNTYLDDLFRFGNGFGNKDEAAPDLFGDMVEVEVVEPEVPQVEAWSALEKLRREKEVIGFYLSGHPLDAHRFVVRHMCNVTLPQLENLEKFKGRELTFAGIVNRAEHRTTRNGKPMGILGLEGIRGTTEIALFSEDYLKFRHFIVDGALLFVKCKVELRTWGHDAGKAELKVESIDLLQDVKDKHISKINIKLNADKFVGERLEQLSALLLSNPGNCQLSLTLFSKDENLSLDVPSKGVQVEINDPLIQELDRLEELDYSLS